MLDASLACSKVILGFFPPQPGGRFGQERTATRTLSPCRSKLVYVRTSKVTSVRKHGRKRSTHDSNASRSNRI